MESNAKNKVEDLKEVEEEDEGLVNKVDGITDPFNPNEIKISTPPMNLGDLIDMINEGWIVFETEYQRESDLWDNIKKSRLIESALLGLRLPAFYFEEVNKKKWKIIDGLQRCCAIRDFCVKKVLVLEDLEFLNFNGKMYDDLDYEFKRDIRMLPITVNLLNGDAPIQVKYVLFKRLNTGGVDLNFPEIRNAVFQGRAIEIVKEMANNDAFKKATCWKISSKRKLDQDFISRFIAFYILGYDNYVPDLESFINKGLDKLRSQDTYSDSSVKEMKDNFSTAMELSYEIFGNDAFRKRYSKDEMRHPINKAYFEVISTCFAHLSIADRDKLKANSELLKSNLIEAMRESHSYDRSFTSSTASPENVKCRFTEFKKIMIASINNQKIEVNDNRISIA